MESVKKLLSSLDNYLSMSAPCLETTKSLITGIIASGTVNLKEVCSRFEKGIESSNYRKVQYFFQRQSFNDAEIIRFIIDYLFSPDEKITLAIDRTDWAFGKTRHNLLCISALYQGTAIPLLILPLERKGNSNCQQRKGILSLILSVLPAKRIKALLGDREFIGDEWFSLLVQNNIPFVMRIRNNTVIGMPNKVVQVKDLYDTKVATDYGNVHIGHQCLHLQTIKNNGNLIAVIAYNVAQPLKLYKKRWGIETGFKCLKSNGLTLKTHILFMQSG